MEYGKQVTGRLNEQLMGVVEDLVRGGGDGRISKLDAEKIMAALVEGNTCTSVEKETIRYIHDRYHWTESAQRWFGDQLQRWTAEFEKPMPMSPNEVSQQRFSREDV